MTVPVSYCTCGHAAQIHGGDGTGYITRYLTPNTPRNQGPCTAQHCPCDNYHQKDPNHGPRN